MTPYYADDYVTIYRGDWRDVPEVMKADAAVTDPPYGIAYQSGRQGRLARSIANDEDTSERDEFLMAWGSVWPALVFGTWRRPRPVGTRMVLVWDTLGALGMGDLSIPWKPSHQEIYVIGSGFTGRRTSDVIACPPVQSTAANGRVHPHEKPVRLMRELIAKCPPGVIADPFMGSGPTLRAAKDLGRKAIGVELEERYCAIAAQRCAQEVLAL